MLNPVFLERMKSYLNDDYKDFVNSYNEQNIRAFTINNRYITNELFEKIFDYSISKIPYTENGYYLNEPDVKLGFHSLHHAGAIYMQDPSAMIPALTFDIPSDAFVLDLCAAPGGKSIQLASKLTNGVLISNEVDFTRAKILYSNIERLGLNNVVVTNNMPIDFLKSFENSFDVILVDAPCSGEGMFRKYPEAIKEWSLENVLSCAKRDKEILDVVHKLLKKDGVIIYSTCTFSKEENEEMIQYMLDNYNYSILDIKSDFKLYLEEGFIDKTYRFYPHKALGEGQFVAIIKKNEGEIFTPKFIKKSVTSKEFVEFSNKYLNAILSDLIIKNNNLYKLVCPYDLSTLKVLNYGVKLGEIYNKRFIPNHNFFKVYPSLFKSSFDLSYDDPLIIKYLRGEQITLPVSNGFGVIKVNGVPLGGYKANNGILNNYYPKGLRNY